eukprot:7235529-Pyramimonas_sp.AAC.1
MGPNRPRRALGSQAGGGGRIRTESGLIWTEFGLIRTGSGPNLDRIDRGELDPRRPAAEAKGAKGKGKGKKATEVYALSPPVSGPRCGNVPSPLT